MMKFLVFALCLCVTSFASAADVDKAAIEKDLAAHEAGLELTKEQDALVSQIGGSSPVIDNAGGPDEFGYTWEDSEEVGGPVYEWYDITATGVSVIDDMIDDNTSGPYPIGFVFPFYGVEYTEFYISSNGTISFDSEYINLVNEFMPTLTYRALIAWFWDDVDPADATDADLMYETIVINNRTALVVSFLNWDEWPGAEDPDEQEDITAQLVMFESGKIIINYNSLEVPGLDLLHSTIGIQDTSGTVGLTVSHNGSIPDYPYDGLALEFSIYELSDLAVTPDLLDFGSIFEGETAVLPLQMSATEDSPVIIDSYTFDYPDCFSMDMALPFTIQPDEVVEFDVTFAPTGPENWSSDLTIHSDAFNPTVTVQISAEAIEIPASELIVSPLELDFGSIMEGETAALPLEISVDGNVPVTIDEATFELPTGYSWDLTLPYSLQPTDVILANVTFAPPFAAAWSSRLWIHSDATNPIVTVIMHGDATVNSVSERGELMPTTLEVAGAYPNPFNATTVIKIRAPQGRTMDAVIYDVRGREVHRYESFQQGGSTTQLEFEADGLPSGLYFCRVTDGVSSVSQKLVLLK
jgi:Secretion system C-terminal sorting domain/HYDIN/CFA65/VesB-like, Ig-like domain